MEKMGEKENWKASDSSPVPTKQNDSNSVRNQTTMKSRGRFPLATLVVGIIVIGIIGVLLFIMKGAV